MNEIANFRKTIRDKFKLSNFFPHYATILLFGILGWFVYSGVGAIATVSGMFAIMGFYILLRTMGNLLSVLAPWGIIIFPIVTILWLNGAYLNLAGIGHTWLTWIIWIFSYIICIVSSFKYLQIYTNIEEMKNDNSGQQREQHYQ